jgi:hypothetical protein
MTTQVVTAGPATQFKDIVTRLAEHRVSATKRRRLERD